MSTGSFILGDRFKVSFLASDSLGVRSMATFISAGDLNIIIDPSSALGPKRYGLPPHPLEVEALKKSLEVIKSKVLESHVAVITHYHYDHHNPGMAHLFKGRVVFVKDPETHINRSQRLRAERFLRELKKNGCEPRVADGRSFDLMNGKVRLKFSHPLTHGPTSKLGYVVSVLVEYEGRKFLFSSDVQGPCTPEQVEFIVNEDPDVAYIDGPVTYMLGYAYSQESLRESLKNLSTVLEKTKVEVLIVDHHLLRDRNFSERIAPVFKLSKALGKRLETCASAMGRENLLLEAHRRDLYKGLFS